MVSSRKLSNEEVEALIEGLSKSTRGSDGVFLDGDTSGVRPFTFGSDDLSLLGDYYALRTLQPFCAIGVLAHAAGAAADFVLSARGQDLR